MERKEQLEFCKICIHKGVDLHKGIICNLTNEQADFEDLCVNFSENTERNKYARADEDESLKNVAKYFNFFLKGKFVTTPLIMLACMVIYAITVSESSLFLIPDLDTLIKYGGNAKSLTITGEYWRLLTANFLHGSLMHLLMNMYSFFAVGFLLERIIGSWRMLLVFVVTGIAASASSVLWGGYVISVGASGALFGLFGVFIMMLTTDVMDRKTRIIILVCELVYVFYSIVMGLQPGIDFAAHIGGFVFGLVVGFGLRFTYVHPEKKIANTLSLITGIVIALVFTVVVMSKADTPNIEYEKALIEFQEEESEALRIYNKYSGSYYNDASKYIIGNSAPRFRKCKSIIHTASQIEGLPEDLQKHSELVEEYCDYFLRVFELSVVKEIRGRTEPDQMLDFCVDRVEYLLACLHDTSFLDSVPIISANEAFFSHMKGAYIVIVDGDPVFDKDEISGIDPLEYDRKGFIGWQRAKAIYGLEASDGAVWIQSRKISIEYVKTLPPGWTRDRYWHAYGLAK